MNRSDQSGAPGEAVHRPLPGVAGLNRGWSLCLQSPWAPIACVLAIGAALEAFQPRSFDPSWLPLIRAVQLFKNSWIHFPILMWIFRREIAPRRMLTENARRGVLIGLASLPLLMAVMPVLMAALLLATKAGLAHLWPNASFDATASSLTWPRLLSGSLVPKSMVGDSFGSVSSGVIEELFLRGFVLQLFIVRGRSPVHAATLVALLFAFLHGSLVLFPYYFIFGLGMAVLARISGSVWAPVVAHATYNLFVHLAFAHIDRGLRFLGLA